MDFIVSLFVDVREERHGFYMEDDKYFIVKKKAVPEVLLKVVEAKRLLDSERVMTIQEATDAVDISRSSFYKYKDDIFPFHENNRGKTINFMMQMDDIPGLLSMVLNQIAKSRANILTIHQTIPIGGIASLTLGIEILPETLELAQMMEMVEALDGIHYLKILGRE
jgi:chorismate mutase